MAGELATWVDTCQPASSARATVSMKSAGSQLTVLPEPSSRSIFNPCTRRRMIDGPGLA